LQGVRCQIRCPRRFSYEQTSVAILAQVFLQASPGPVNASSRATTLSLSAATRLDILHWVGNLVPPNLYSVPSVAATDKLFIGWVELAVVTALVQSRHLFTNTLCANCGLLHRQALQLKGFQLGKEAATGPQAVHPSCSAALNIVGLIQPSPTSWNHPDRFGPVLAGTHDGFWGWQACEAFPVLVTEPSWVDFFGDTQADTGCSFPECIPRVSRNRYTSVKYFDKGRPPLDRAEWIRQISGGCSYKSADTWEKMITLEEEQKTLTT